MKFGKIIKENTFFNTTGNTSISNIKKAIEFFKNNPDGKISSGVWTDGEWDKRKFDEFLKRSLNAKINSKTDEKGRKYSNEYQSDLQRDRKTIEDYLNSRIRNRGGNSLRTKEMQKKYPEINNQKWEEDW